MDMQSFSVKIRDGIAPEKATIQDIDVFFEDKRITNLINIDFNHSYANIGTARLEMYANIDLTKVPGHLIPSLRSDVD